MSQPKRTDTSTQRRGASRRTAPVRLAPEATAGQAFQAIAAGCVDRFQANSVLLANNAAPEALHRARVALRQLRSALSIFDPIVHDWRFEPLKKEFGWLATTMNEARDLDALMARYEIPPVQLVRARKRAIRQATKAIASARAQRLWCDFAEWLDHGIWLDVRNPPNLLVSEFASASLDRLRARVKKKARGLRKLDDKALHKLRIAAKTLRYATEFFAGLLDGPVRERQQELLKKAARELQDTLGDHRDCTVAKSLLERLEVPGDLWPALPGRVRLSRRANRALEQLMDCEPYWK